MAQWMRPVAVIRLPAVYRRGLAAVYAPPVSAPISSPFGPRLAPVAGASTDHKGIDYAVPVGTPVAAAAAGLVVAAGPQGTLGNAVRLDHGGGETTVYGHLSQVFVSVGQFVAAGDTIGLSGATGLVSGPNLHFMVLFGGQPVDPLLYFSGAPVDVGLPVAAPLQSSSFSPGSAPAGAIEPATDAAAVALAVAALGVLIYGLS